MVRAKTRRPTRRNRNAGPARTHRAAPPSPDAARPLDEDKYPNLAARREMDRQERLRRGRAMGLTREQASRHATLETGSGE